MKKPPKYDIFISYRRDTGAQYARTLQLMLEKKGYRVFLDYDELVDDVFSPQVHAAVISAPIFVIVMSKGCLERCVNDGDWVRRELETAIDSGSRIIPVNPDGTFDGFPANLPGHIKRALGETQHSEIHFGQTLNATVDMMVKNRISPYVRRSTWRRLVIPLILICALAITGIIVWDAKQAAAEQAELEALKQEVTFKGRQISWPADISKTRILAVKAIIDTLTPIDGGEYLQGAVPLADGSLHEYVEPEFETPAHREAVSPFYLSKFEVTIGQWNAIMLDSRDGDPALPVASVTFSQAKAFADSLFNLTEVEFRLPTETEWEYAAKGGPQPEEYLFAGSDEPTKVAWYSKNSGGRSHADLLSTPTSDDIFNLSGNVSEWCDTRFEPYDTTRTINVDNAMVIRGGNYDSEPYEITVTHREPALPETSIPTLGFRVAVSR